MKTVFLFAGQGAQHIGMGTDFYRKYGAYKQAVDTFSDTSELIAIMDNGPEELLQNTGNTQPCMALFAIGVLAVLSEYGINPDAVCGLSIGEYGALYAAGMISMKEYMDIVTYRGKVMAEAAEGISCAMSAIVGLEASDVEKAVFECESYGFVAVANYNCPGQYVICGDETTVEKCEEKCKELGAKQAIRLKTGGPFHTKYMKNAGEKLRAKLDDISFQKPRIPVLLNVSGTYFSGENMSDILEQQIQKGVHFEDELKRLIEDGYDTFIEIGPGKTLAGFVKRTAKKYKVAVNTFSIDCVQDIEDLLLEIG